MSTKRLIKRTAIGVNRQKVSDNIDWTKHYRQIQKKFKYQKLEFNLLSNK